MKITNEILEGYLNCKTKGFLIANGQSGTVSDYHVMRSTERAILREAVVNALLAKHGNGESCRGLAFGQAALQSGLSFLADATLLTDRFCIRFDALKREDTASAPCGNLYLPVLFSQKTTLGTPQKLLAACLGLILVTAQGIQPSAALFVHRPDGRLRRLCLDTSLYRHAQETLSELAQQLVAAEAPRLALNRHCRSCQYQHRCHKEAEEADDISLLGVGEKELLRYNRKGLFTITQLACTFRARRRAKRVRRAGRPHYASLQALSIRKDTIHVYGAPEVPGTGSRFYFDAEGSEDGAFVYLLGLLATDGPEQQMHSFWADNPGDELRVFDEFLDMFEGVSDFALFHYGTYETRLLKRMRCLVKRKTLVDRLITHSVNALKAIHGTVYFPTFSNGLKDVSRWLGFHWSTEDSSGTQSIVWRARWEQHGLADWKDRLLAYNAEDCTALRIVTDFLRALADGAEQRGTDTKATIASHTVAWADAIHSPSKYPTWQTPTFVLDEMDRLNRCAYFDYQRDKVFVCTSRCIRRSMRRQKKSARQKRLPVNKEMTVEGRQCPYCNSEHIARLPTRCHSKIAYDLRFAAGSIRRQVVRCSASRYRCEMCRRTFLPTEYKRLDKYQNGLKSWVIHQYLVHRSSLAHVSDMLLECFQLRMRPQEVFMIKCLMASRYAEAYNKILARILSGGLIHSDETHANLRKQKVYVWMLANLEDVYYMCRPGRETAFLLALLQPFTGVLVSDFYSGYDALPCEQQKCLVHLIRDINDDLKCNPYDAELMELAVKFAALLRGIVDTIDKRGLKKRYLQRHTAEVTNFFEEVGSQPYKSDVAQGYQKRFAKNRAKLFTFINHDGVPWNNNVAEHAAKTFAAYRRLTDGRVEETGLSDYLVLLSIAQTCKYRGVSFLRFLLSGASNVDDYCQQRAKKKQTTVLDVYPPGFPRMYGDRRYGQQGVRRRRDEA